MALPSFLYKGEKMEKVGCYIHIPFCQKSAITVIFVHI